jgi:hypothetical protein
MAKKRESKWNLDKLTDAEIYTAILYLEQDPKSASEQDDAAAFENNGAIVHMRKQSNVRSGAPGELNEADTLRNLSDERRSV